MAQMLIEQHPATATAMFTFLVFFGGIVITAVMSERYVVSVGTPGLTRKYADESFGSTREQRRTRAALGQRITWGTEASGNDPKRRKRKLSSVQRRSPDKPIPPSEQLEATSPILESWFDQMNGALYNVAFAITEYESVFSKPSITDSFTHSTTSKGASSPDMTESLVQLAEPLAPEQCNDSSVHVVSELWGRLEWEGHNMSVNCSWLIDLDPAYGVVVAWQEVRLAWGLRPEKDDMLSVFAGQHLREEVKVLKQYDGQLPVAPLLVRSHRALLRLLTHTRDLARVTRKGSKLVLTYRAQALKTLPPEVDVGLYNCSPPYVVPQALRCDMAVQCEGMEDERQSNCTYFQRQCDRGVPFGDSCLWFVRKKSVSPNSLYGMCSDWQKDPAAIVNDDVKNFLASVTSLSGQEELLVAAKRTPHLDFRFRSILATKAAIAHNELDPRLLTPDTGCAVLRVRPKVFLKPVPCWNSTFTFLACTSSPSLPTLQTQAISLPPVDPAAITRKREVRLKQCKDGSYVQLFHVCSAQWSYLLQPHDQSHNNFTLFQCENGRLVHFALTCDGTDDCGDESDEDKNLFWCPRILNQYTACDSLQLVHVSQLCNGRRDCFDNSDEDRCDSCKEHTTLCGWWGCVPESYRLRGRLRCETYSIPEIELRQTLLMEARNMSAPQQLDLDVLGMVQYTYMKESQECPETHFRCPPHFCIPSYFVGDFVVDCPFPSGHDEYASHYLTEQNMYNPTVCVGYYRCYEYGTCLHPDFLCDGIYQCPLKDDERYCNIPCPANCTCEGLAFRCSQSVNLSQFPLLRYLDLSGTEGLDSESFTLMPPFVKFLNISQCGLMNVNLRYLGKLRILDASFNKLQNFSIFSSKMSMKTLFPSLTHLNLNGNPVFDQTDTSADSWHVPYYAFRFLESLSLQDTGIRHIPANVFSQFPHLKHLDLRDNRFSFDRSSFLGLTGLQQLYTDDPIVCCAVFSLYPEAKMECIAPVDEISSCSDLLRTDFLRTVLWLLSVLAVLGNVGVLVYRVFLEPGGTYGGYRVLVSNLCVSDLLMGLYLLMVGWADARLKGSFVWKRDEWTSSMTCRSAGFLALMSSEVSAFIICLITVDRLLVMRLPLKRHLHLTARSAMLMCSVAWLVGVVLAVVPLLPANEAWDFYSQSAICLPLPITQNRLPGQHYAFAVFIILNFFLFLVVGAGQLFIYQSVRSANVAISSKRRHQDTVIARRLLLIVFSDFCCWFPVSLMGLLAVCGMPIPRVVNIWAAILVLPVNSAINPFLYTLATLRDRRKRQREQERIQAIMGRLHAEVLSWPKEKLLELYHHVGVALERRMHTDYTEPSSQQAATSSALCDAGPAVKKELNQAATQTAAFSLDEMKLEARG